MLHINEIQTNFINKKPFQCQIIKVIAFLNIYVNKLLMTLDKTKWMNLVITLIKTEIVCNNAK